VLALGVQRVGGDDPPGKVQPVQQGPEPGDLVGGVVHHGQQVDLSVTVVAAAAQGLAVDCDRLPPRRPGHGWLLVGQPPADDQIQCVGVDAGQHAAHGGLAWWPPDPAQRVATDPERGQDRLGRVRCPFPDRGQGAGAGQHGGDRDGQHRAQGVPAAASLSGVGNRGEVVEQAAALVGCQRDRSVQPLSDREDAR
jgi:hypothetical protein